MKLCQFNAHPESRGKWKAWCRIHKHQQKVGVGRGINSPEKTIGIGSFFAITIRKEIGERCDQKGVWGSVTRGKKQITEMKHA